MGGLRSRTIGIACVALALVGLAVSIPAMARRLSQRAITVVWFDEPVTTPEFAFKGLPVVVRTRAPGAGNLGAVEIDWRGTTSRFEIDPGVKDDPRLPGLLRHEDWLSVLLFAQGARSEDELKRALADGSITPRLVVGMRLPAPGVDPETWGQARKRDWRYRFVELLPDGPVEESVRVAEGTFGELDNLGDPDWRRAEGREEEAWKYSVMMRMTPSTLFRVSARERPVQSALAAMGWTWPVAGSSFALLTVGAVLFSLAGVGRDRLDEGSEEKD
ncbi:MAG TPA: hypothetical protein DEB06_02545 [Phycisphaerales bacterium]|nr:hypothetical protein [Phycisphaerales bacterium]